MHTEFEDIHVNKRMSFFLYTFDEENLKGIMDHKILKLMPRFTAAEKHLIMYLVNLSVPYYI